MNGRRGVAVISAAALIAGGALAAWRWHAARNRVMRPTTPVSAVPHADSAVPAGVRIRVEVINATRVRGLARRATEFLRHRGFDVVASGTARQQRDTTLVIDRSGHPEWARRVADALGRAVVQAHPDSSRYLDVTVLLGATWHPPAEPFYP